MTTVIEHISGVHAPSRSFEHGDGDPPPPPTSWRSTAGVYEQRRADDVPRVGAHGHAWNSPPRARDRGTAARRRGDRVDVNDE